MAKSTKSITKILLSAGIALTFILCAFLPATAGPSEDALAEVLQEVLSEPKVKSAAWNDKSLPSLLVGVWDDGTNRDGYAGYFCLIMAQHGIGGGVVRIMDERAAQKDEWRELGKAWCGR